MRGSLKVYGIPVSLQIYTALATAVARGSSRGRCRECVCTSVRVCICVRAVQHTAVSHYICVTVEEGKARLGTELARLGQACLGSSRLPWLASCHHACTGALLGGLGKALTARNACRSPIAVPKPVNV